MIYFVRHGQTDWNKEGRIQGHTDIELNQIGINQAMQVKEKLKDIKFDIVFASPLKRAYKTAQVIHQGNIVTDARLLERGNGQLEGKTKNQIQVWPNFNDPTDTSYGIESLTNFRARVNSFITEIQTKHKGKNILVVTHGGVCIYARCYFEGEPKDNDYESYKLKNCDVLSYKN